MEAILFLIALVCALRSHYACKRAFDRYSYQPRVKIAYQKPLYTPAGQESSWLGPIVIGILILLVHFLT
jgi:hypothetical protein